MLTVYSEKWDSNEVKNTNAAAVSGTGNSLADAIKDSGETMSAAVVEISEEARRLSESLGNMKDAVGSMLDTAADASESIVSDAAKIAGTTLAAAGAVTQIIKDPTTGWFGKIMKGSAVLANGISSIWESSKNIFETTGNAWSSIQEDYQILADEYQNVKITAGNISDAVYKYGAKLLGNAYHMALTVRDAFSDIKAAVTGAEKNADSFTKTKPAVNAYQYKEVKSCLSLLA